MHCDLTMRGRYDVDCYGSDGSLKWSESFHNRITTAGLNKYLDATLKTGLASPAWYVGLVTGPGSGNTYAAADTMSSHAGWLSDTHFSEAARQAWTPGTVAAGSVDNSASRAVFTMSASATIAGCFVTDSSTKAGTTGTLLSVGNFSGGDRTLVAGDQIKVTFTASVTAS